MKLVIPCSVWCGQELIDVVCVTASPDDGKLIYVSDARGRLHCVDASHRDVIATWKPDDATTTSTAAAAAAAASHDCAILTSLSATVLSDDIHLITAVDNTGRSACV